MQLQHRFTMPAPIDVAWNTLNDVERVGACFPGATVTSVDGDEFTGTCKVKLGPISMQYSGSGRFLERDAERHRAVIEAKGKDRRGNGTAAVTLTTVLTPEGEDRTAVSVDTDLSITGKPAQFGRGVIQDVSNRLLGQFTECLGSQVGAMEPAAAAATGVTAAAGTVTDAPTAVDESGSAVGSGPPTTAAAEPPEPATETPPAAATATGIGVGSGGSAAGSGSAASDASASALDLGATVLPVLAKRYAPHALGVLAVLLVLWRVLRR